MSSESVSVFFEGATDLAVPYVPLGKQLAYQLRDRLNAQGITSGNETHVIPDGMIFVRCSENHLSVRIRRDTCDLYLESGQLDAEHYAPHDELLHTPGQWYIGNLE